MVKNFGLNMVYNLFFKSHKRKITFQYSQNILGLKFYISKYFNEWCPTNSQSQYFRSICR